MNTIVVQTNRFEFLEMPAITVPDEWKIVSHVSFPESIANGPHRLIIEELNSQKLTRPSFTRKDASVSCVALKVFSIGGMGMSFQDAVNFVTGSRKNAPIGHHLELIREDIRAFRAYFDSHTFYATDKGIMCHRMAYEYLQSLGLKHEDAVAANNGCEFPYIFGLEHLADSVGQSMIRITREEALGAASGDDAVKLNHWTDAVLKDGVRSVAQLLTDNIGAMTSFVKEARELLGDGR